MVFLKATSTYKSRNSSVLDFRNGEKFMVVDFGAVEGYVRVINKRGKIGYVPLTGDCFRYVVHATRKNEQSFIDAIIGNIQVSRDGDINKEDLKLLRDLYKLRFLIAAYGTNWSQKVSIKGTRFCRSKKYSLVTKDTQTEDFGCGEVNFGPFTTATSHKHHGESFRNDDAATKPPSGSGDRCALNRVQLLDDQTPKNTKVRAPIRKARYFRYRRRLAGRNHRQNNLRYVKPSRKKIENIPRLRREKGPCRKERASSRSDEEAKPPHPNKTHHYPEGKRKETRLHIEYNKSNLSIFRRRANGKSCCSIEDVRKQLRHTLGSDPVAEVCEVADENEKVALGQTIVTSGHHCSQIQGASFLWCDDDTSCPCGEMVQENPVGIITQQKRLIVAGLSAVTPKLRLKNEQFALKFLEELRDFICVCGLEHYTDVFSKQGEHIAGHMVRYYVEEPRLAPKLLVLDLMKDLCTRNPAFKNDICCTNLPSILIDDIQDSSKHKTIEIKAASIGMFSTLLSPPQAALFLMNLVDEHFLTCLMQSVTVSATENVCHRNCGTELVAASLDLLLNITRFSKFALLMSEVVSKNNRVDDFLSELLTNMFLNRGVEGVFGPSALLLKQMLELSSRTGLAISSCRLEDAFEVIVHYISTTSLVDKACITWCLDTLLLLLMSPLFKVDSHHWKNADHILNRLGEFEGTLSSQEMEKLESLKSLIDIRRKEDYRRLLEQSKKLPKAVRSDSTVQKRSRPVDAPCGTTRFPFVAVSTNAQYPANLTTSKWANKSASSIAVAKLK